MMAREMATTRVFGRIHTASSVPDDGPRRASYPPRHTSSRTATLSGMKPDDPLPELYTETRTSDLGSSVGKMRPQVLGLVILAHPDATRVGEMATLPDLSGATPELLSRQQPLFAQPGRDGPFRPLAESHVSRSPWLLQGRGDGSVLLQAASSRTPIRIAGEEVEASLALTREAIEDGVVMVLSQRVALLLGPVDPVPSTLPNFGLIGDSSAMTALRQDIRTAANLEVPVLLRGETGSGKELVANALHQAGGRRKGPFVAVNMGVLTPSLAAAELFGATKGAYTGADRHRPGLFQQSEGGTLFLDEIGEAPAEVQVMLLRILEDRRVQPVGSNESFVADVRIIAATDAKLEQAIERGAFREPLLHRLAGLSIDVPALRRRRDDIPRLFQFFVQLESERLTSEGLASEGLAIEGLAIEGLTAQALPPLAAELVARLVKYDWPGNVRQLRNVARQWVVAHNAGSPDSFVAQIEALLESPDGPELPPTKTTTPPTEASKRRWFRKRTDVEESELIEALEKHRWQLRPAAKQLGVSRATLYRLIESSPSLRKATDLDRSEVEAAIGDCGGDFDAAAAKLKVSPQGLKRRWRPTCIWPRCR